MRGSTLLKIRTMLKAECGYNMDAGVATGEDKRFNMKLENMQQFLWSQYQWPFLYTHADVALVPNQRFYNFPAAVSFDYPTMAEVYWVNLWMDVDFGIKGPQYSDVNPDLNQTLDPVQRWQNYTLTQFEVWPMPGTGQTLRFWGTGSLPPLQADVDVALLDDLLITYFTAAELLAKSKQQDAKSFLAKGTALFNRLKAADRPDMVFTLGGRDPDSTARRNQRIVGIVGNPNH